MPAAGAAAGLTARLALARATRKFVGAHVGAAQGVSNAVGHAAEIESAAFALFLKSRSTWQGPPISAAEAARFRQRLAEQGYDAQHVLPHGCYLVNLGNAEADKQQKSQDAFLDELKRCEQLGLRLFNFHPGATVGTCTRAEAIARIAAGINWAHGKTADVVTVVENMAGQGTTVGGQFEDLAAIIAEVKDKARVGVCLDTCHLFAAGYDVRTAASFEAVMQKFDSIVGAKYLRAMHLNDSKGDLGSRLDRHENIGKGKIGLECFRFVMNSPRFNDIPLILETPPRPEGYAPEVSLLYSLCA